MLLVDYVTYYDISKQHNVLNHNAFSFLIVGTKEDIFDNSSLSIAASKLLLMKAGHCLMTEKRTAVKIIGEAIKVHNLLSPGLLESTSESCSVYEIK
ncbi:hypothetical protein [Polaribacter sp.]|jgi:hypothetical protein|uniref:hypothetical protein n=1 Tax=Polaribacter sp. TaxID=1920175 RepID=UPI0040478F79